MKRLTALLCLVVLLIPSAASPAIFQTLFPPAGQFFVEIVTESSLDGIHHALLGIRTDNIDFYAVLMASSGAPDPAGSWVFGTIQEIQQVDPTTFNITWNISVSSGGVNAIWVPAGTLTVTISI
jgi:hypothetical protein